MTLAVRAVSLINPAIGFALRTSFNSDGSGTLSVTFCGYCAWIACTAVWGAAGAGAGMPASEALEKGSTLICPSATGVAGWPTLANAPVAALNRLPMRDPGLLGPCAAGAACAASAAHGAGGV